MLGLNHQIKKRGYISSVSIGEGGKKALCCVMQNYAAMDIL